MKRLDQIEGEWKRKKVPSFNPGDVVDVHVKITEGDKERVQIFTGTVIKKRGEGLSEMFTVRRLVQGEGVERIFPIHSPRLIDVVVKKPGKVRRAKLYYLRGRVGRATKVEEKIGVRVAEAKPAPAEEKSDAPKAQQETPKAEAVAKETK